MTANKLVINDDETHLLVLGTKSMAEKRNLVRMQDKLLGCIVRDNLKWRHHILYNEQSMVRQLTIRVNGLAMITSKADFSTKLMVANGFVVSKVCYLIQLWGGTEGYLLNSLQVQLNRVARLGW